MEEIQPDDFQLINEIGSGSTSVVYKATFREFIVAVKELQFSHQEAEDDFNRQTIQRELSVLSSARHPSILHFYGLVTEWPVRLVLEYCDGGSLFELLHNRKKVRLSWPQRLVVLGDTSLAMRYLHAFEPPIMHRDLKSLNIMLLKPVLDEYARVHVRLADFGFARSFDEAFMTKGVGTKHWMAPEVLRRTDYTEKADVFSFAMVIYEAVCRHVPFEDLTPDVVAGTLAHGGRPKFEDYVALDRIPRGLPDLAKSCWAGKPNDRPSFGAVADTVRQISTSRSETFSL